MTEFLTDDWGFFVRTCAPVRALHLAVPDGGGARHRAVRQAVPPRRLLHDVGEGRVLLSRESRPRRGGHASAARARAGRRRRRRRLGRGDPEAPVDQVGDAGRDRPRGRRHLAQVSAGGAPRRARRSAAHAADRGRLRLRAQLRPSTFDLIVLDLTDPGGPSTPLYTPEFYRACAARLSPMGALTLHVASPVAHPERIRATLANLRSAFAIVSPYLTSVPLYGGLWMMACCSALLDPRAHDAAAGRPPHRAARARASPVLQRRHAPRRLRAAELRARARRLTPRYVRRLPANRPGGRCRRERPPRALSVPEKSPIVRRGLNEAGTAPTFGTMRGESTPAFAAVRQGHGSDRMSCSRA